MTLHALSLFNEGKSARRFGLLSIESHDQKSFLKTLKCYKMLHFLSSFKFRLGKFVFVPICDDIAGIAFFQ